jgi:hypothetical protein
VKANRTHTQHVINKIIAKAGLDEIDPAVALEMARKKRRRAAYDRLVAARQEASGPGGGGLR